MRQYRWRLLVMSVMVLIVGAPALFAQKYEINAYGGYVWPARTNVGQLENQAIWGARGGVFLDSNFELEGTFGYLNRFKVEGVPDRTRGMLWEAAGNYNFSQKDWPVVRQFTPFLVVGAGAIRTHIKDVDDYSFISTGGGTVTPVGGFTPVGLGRVVNVNDGDTFFTISYGGGFKSVRLWGPLGLRFEARGRTMPNYYHSTPTWLEATGGINFMWGEK